VPDPKEQQEQERAKLVGRASWVALGTLVSRILGLMRDMVLAAVFPKTATDAFFVAFTIPNALRQLLGEGAVSSAVVPVLSKRLTEGGDEAGRHFFARARGASLLALVVVTFLGLVFATQLTELFASGYHAVPGKFERTVDLTRTVFPYIFFMGSAALGMAALNAKKRFKAAAFAPGLLNVAFLACCFGLPGLLVRHGYDDAQAMCIGALIGGVLQVAAQWPSLRAIGYAGLPVLDLRDPHVRTMLKRIAPMITGIGVYYIDLILSRRFLSELGDGAQSYFSWASRLCDFPQGIFIMALSTAALPSLSELAAKNDVNELRSTFTYSLRLGLFVALPASVLLVALGEPLTSVMFERGKFTAFDVHETARALWIQGAAVFTVSIVRQTVPLFYALGDTRTPVWISAVDLLAFIALAVALKAPMGHVGISMAVAGSSLVQMLLLLGFARRKLKHLNERELGASALRTLTASVLAGACAWSVSAHVPWMWLAALLGLIVFGATFLTAAWGMKSPELALLTDALSRRLGKR
jgi:putative peptidoglycan lipid II flippase